ncbi:MAG: nucleoside monophosphate kinase [Bacilli bacterium]|nr:nucleoside monophosphate kinase [Bacilli bacterium]MDD4809030.1 nucleoside monophosphate kinase [Bacilli bacterium]
MKSIILLAPPAAGKGTQSALISEKYRIPHISTGDLLRNAVRDNNPSAELIANLINSGSMVNDEIVLALLKMRLNQSDCDNGYILDGFPRNVDQAIAYEKILKDLNKELGIVIFLDLDKELALQRIIGRLSCSNCGQVYNSMYEETKPKVDNQCDNCQTKLSRRDDDNEKTFNTRFEVYLEKTQPLIDYYEEKGILYRINSGISKDYTFNEIEKIIGGLYD